MMAGQCQTPYLIMTTLILCCITVLIKMSFVSGADSALFIRLHNFDGYLHTKYNLTSLTPVDSIIYCARICKGNPECGSFFYLDKLQKLCQTHSLLFETKDEAIIESSATYYQLIKEWFPWSSWSSCTVTCGGGTRIRQRECYMNYDNKLAAPCVGPKEELVNCHTFSCLPLARTCTELGQRGLTEDDNVEIDPDGPGLTTLEPVIVFCDMTSHSGIGVTVIGHNHEARYQVKGYEENLEYNVTLIYNISFGHAVSVIDQSSYCEQYISWECLRALIHDIFSTNKSTTTGWLNRTGGLADYFGGAKPGSKSCACGMNHSCALRTELCNCDYNDGTWLQDDGFLTYKDDLPVYAFLAGDTGGDKEDGYYQIGPVRCHGNELKYNTMAEADAES